MCWFYSRISIAIVLRRLRYSLGCIFRLSSLLSRAGVEVEVLVVVAESTILAYLDRLADLLFFCRCAQKRARLHFRVREILISPAE